MSDVNLAVRKPSAFSLVDKFIKSTEEIEFKPFRTTESQEAENALHDIVKQAARFSDISVNEAYHNVASYVAAQKGYPSKEKFLEERCSALSGVVRRAGYRCGEPVPGWGGK